ncbi:MAG: lyase family protein, partial [Actinomycetota bacterium]|nr:lyase family protein [Actinomycetota bacterium]
MLDPGFTTAEMAAVFSASNRVDALLEFEAALALAMADVGVAPRDAAEAVAEACRASIPDPDVILAATWTEGSPLIPLTNEIRSRLSKADGEWVHQGATTQDAVDTAAMLQAREALDILDTRLTAVARLVASMVIEFREQPQIGRTFLQHARPTTFGLRAASWLDPTVRHISALRRARGELVVQLGGPVGNLARYDDRGVEMMGALAARLGLETPTLPWH